jgi:hypothetical protein
MDLCKIPAFDGVQGKSLVPIIDDAQASVRDYVLVEDDIAAITAKLTPIPGKTRTLITETHRYTRNSKGEEQLFDLQTDPDEMSDIKQTQPVARSAALEAMTDALIEADDVARGAPVTNNSRRDDRASTLT